MLLLTKDVWQTYKSLSIRSCYHEAREVVALGQGENKSKHLVFVAMMANILWD